MKPAYHAYVAALRQLEDATARGDLATREAQAAGQAGRTLADRRAAQARERLAEVSALRDDVLARVAALPVTPPVGQSHGVPRSSDPVALAEQLVARAADAVAGCRDDIAAVERQRRRLADVRAALDAERLRAEELAAAQLLEARAKAAAGDRLLLPLGGGVVAGAFVAGFAGPPGTAIVAALILAVVFTFVACRRPSSLPARLGGRDAAASVDAFPPRGRAVVAIFALACAGGGVGVLLAGLAHTGVLDQMLGVAVAVCGGSTAVLLRTRRSTGEQTT